MTTQCFYIVYHATTKIVVAFGSCPVYDLPLKKSHDKEIVAQVDKLPEAPGPFIVKKGRIVSTHSRAHRKRLAEHLAVRFSGISAPTARRAEKSEAPRILKHGDSS